MSSFIRTVGLAVVLTITFTSGSVLAAGKGQDDLDNASEAKLTAATMGDLGEVVRLAESALQKGLDPTSTEFAKKLLAATLLERAKVVAEHLKTATSLDQLKRERQIALADLDKAIAADAKQPEVYLLVAKLNMLPAGSLKNAHEAFSKAISLGINDAADRADAFRARGAISVEMGDPEQALDDFDKAIELKPNDAAAYEDKAKVLDKLKRYDEALATVAKLQRLIPNVPDPWLQEAVIHVHQSKLDAALDDLNHARTIKPEDVAALLLRASVYNQMGDKKKALEDADEALNLRPGLPIVIRTHALLLAENGQLDAAVAELESVLRTEAADAATLLQLGVLQSAQGQPTKAIKTYSDVLAAAPDQWEALRGRGDAYLNLGRQADAIADYEASLKLQPGDEGILNNLAWVLATSPDGKLRDGRRAIRLATAACEANNYKRAYTLSTLAAAYAETGDFDTAIRWSTKAVKIGEQDQLDSLKKELASYKAHQPWREAMSAEKPSTTKSKKP